MNDLDRRAVLTGLVGAAALLWVGSTRRATAPSRVRGGQALRLHCEGADAFRLEGLVEGAHDAEGGALTLFAPQPSAELARLRCTPLRRGRPWGEAVEVTVVVMSPRFGA